jgi:hypothetical protein
MFVIGIATFGLRVHAPHQQDTDRRGPPGIAIFRSYNLFSSLLSSESARAA